MCYIAGLITSGSNLADKETMYMNIARDYIKSMDDMGGRGPGGLHYNTICLLFLTIETTDENVYKKVDQ